MQGIQLNEFKKLLDSLNSLRQKEIFDLPLTQFENVLESETALKEIYTDYKRALQQVSEVVSRFEQHKNSIRALVRQNKNYLRKKGIITSEM